MNLMLPEFCENICLFKNCLNCLILKLLCTPEITLRLIGHFNEVLVY